MLPRDFFLFDPKSIWVFFTFYRVCLSVHHVPVFYGNGLTYCHSFFTTRQPSHSGFMIIKHIHEIPMGPPPAGALNTGGV